MFSWTCNRERLLDAKTATNSHTSAISQVLCAEFSIVVTLMNTWRIFEIFIEHAEMLINIDKVFTKVLKGIPDGGLFTWVELPENINNWIIEKKR